jgi:hypothetical protein
MGLLALAICVTICWLAYLRTQRSSAVLLSYLEEESSRLQAAAIRLNEHGFGLQQTSSDLFPKLERVAALFDQPLIAASLPWLLRRLLMRPFKKRR